MPTWLDVCVKLTPAFITFIVGAAASWIAFLQYRIANNKFRLDLFNKRLEAYDKLQEFLVAVMQEGTVSPRGLSLLAQARYKSRFLFGSEVDQYVDTMWPKATRLQTLRSLLYDELGNARTGMGEERGKICDEEGGLLKWFTQQMKDSEAIYAPYLRFKV